MWKEYEPFIKAIIELFHPFAEAAVHDLNKGKVVAIYHNFSQRKVGDPSPLHELKVKTADFPPYFTPYYKQNWDGRPLKCTSITLRDKKNKPAFLICFNIDVSSFQDQRQLLDAFLSTKKDSLHPIDRFGSDLEDQTATLLQQYLDEHHLSLKHLNRDQKKALVQALYRKGVFNFKNAAPFIAKKLNASRATIYNYIKQLE